MYEELVGSRVGISWDHEGMALTRFGECVKVKGEIMTMRWNDGLHEEIHVAKITYVDGVHVP